MIRALKFYHRSLEILIVYCDMLTMDAVPMDTVTPDIETLSKNLYASLDPTLSNDDRTIVYQVRSSVTRVLFFYFI